MIVSPDVFTKIQRQFLLSNSSLWGEFPFKVSPESFQSIDMIPLSISVLSFSMIHQTVNVPFRCDPGIRLPGIGTDNRSGRYIPAYQRLDGSCFYIIHHFCPNGTVPAEDPEYWLLLRSSPSFGSLIPNHLSFIPPLTSEIGLIDLDSTGEDVRDILGEYLPDDSKSSENSSPFNRCSKRDRLAALFQEEPEDYFFPLILCQIQWEPMWCEVIETPRASAFSGSQQVYFFRPAFWALYPDHFFPRKLCTSLVVKMLLYPSFFPVIFPVMREDYGVIPSHRSFPIPIFI